jgi:hypothetical protein
MLQTGAKGLQPCDLLGAHVEAPLVPVPTGYQMGGGGTFVPNLLYRSHFRYQRASEIGIDAHFSTSVGSVSSSGSVA